MRPRSRSLLPRLQIVDSTFALRVGRMVRPDLDLPPMRFPASASLRSSPAQTRAGSAADPDLRCGESAFRRAQRIAELQSRRCVRARGGEDPSAMARGVRDRKLNANQAREELDPAAINWPAARRGYGHDFLRRDLQHGFAATCTKLNSRAASSAFTASFIFERAMKFPKKISNSARLNRDYTIQIFRDQRGEGLGTDNPTPSFTASAPSDTADPRPILRWPCSRRA